MTENSYSQPAQSPERELLATFTEWARQVAAREDVPRGIRSAAAGLHDDGKRMLAKAAFPAPEGGPAPSHIAAMEQALEALTVCRLTLSDHDLDGSIAEMDCKAAITTLRAALAARPHPAGYTAALATRSATAIACLPDAPYKVALQKLHDDMLAALAAQHQQAGPETADSVAKLLSRNDPTLGLKPQIEAQQAGRPAPAEGAGPAKALERAMYVLENFPAPGETVSTTGVQTAGMALSELREWQGWFNREAKRAWGRGPDAEPDVQPKGTAFDAIQRALDLASLHAGSVAANDRDGAAAHRHALRDHLIAWMQPASTQAPAPGAVQLPSPITEEMHVAACKVLTRAHGLDGLPQRMLDAMRAAAPAQCAAVAQPNRALAAEVLRVCASISQHIEQGVASEALEATRRPGYGTGIYTYLMHRVEDLRAAARAEVQPPVQGSGQ